MELYFSPMTCSLASRIALYEAGVDATFHQVSLFDDDPALDAVNPLGQVPTLRTNEGRVLTENAAVLQFIGSLGPSAPEADPIALTRWLSFIGTELHKVVFYPLFDPTAPAEARRWVVQHKAPPRLALMDAHLRSGSHVVGVPSVADAYLFTVLCWIPATPLSLEDYPSLARFHAECLSRPSYARAHREELRLFREAQASRGAETRPRTSRH